MPISKTGFSEMLFGPGATSQAQAFPLAPSQPQGGLFELLGGIFGPPPGTTAQQPGAMSKPSFMSRMLAPEVALPMAAQLMGQSGNMANIGNAFGAAAPALKANRTRQYINEHEPEIAKLMDMGLDAKDAWGLMLERRKLANEAPKPPQVETFYDEGTGQAYKAAWDGASRSWQRVGGVKGDEGFEVTLPDGTSVRQGSFGNQDRKNVANRVSEDQEATKVASQLKQSVGLLRQANKNTGYSGVGAGLYSAVDDTLEQFGAGSVLPGTAGARATMRAGSLDAALANVAKTKGAISNAEMGLFMAASPGMQNTPQGNAAMLDMLDAIADRQIQRNGEMEKWRQQHGTLDGFESAWGQYIDENPLLIEDGAGGITLASNAGARASGAGSQVNTTSSGAKWRVR